MLPLSTSKRSASSVILSPSPRLGQGVKNLQAACKRGNFSHVMSFDCAMVRLLIKYRGKVLLIRLLNKRLNNCGDIFVWGLWLNFLSRTKDITPAYAHFLA